MKWIVVVALVAGYVNGVMRLSKVAMGEAQKLANAYSQTAHPDQLLNRTSQLQLGLDLASK